MGMSTNEGTNMEDAQTEPTGTRALTGEEEEIYDRQIRLWGADAQRRLAASKVLIVGATETVLSQELTKNLVLSGISTLTLCDLYCHEERDMGFLNPGGAGMKESLTAINPLVAVVEVPADRATSQTVEGYSLVCAVDASSEDESRFGEVCRTCNVPFICGRSGGLVGMFFVDFGAKYAYTRKPPPPERAEDADAVREPEEAEVSFVSFDQAVKSQWGDEPRKSECGWHVYECIRAFQYGHERLPWEKESDSTDLLAVYKDLCKKKSPRSTNEDLIADVGRTFGFKAGPVEAIIGGMWGREAIKCLSRHEEPINNFFFFNARTNDGTIETVGHCGSVPENVVSQSEVVASTTVTVSE